MWFKFTCEMDTVVQYYVSSLNSTCGLWSFSISTYTSLTVILKNLLLLYPLNIKDSWIVIYVLKDHIILKGCSLLHSTVAICNRALFNTTTFKEIHNTSVKIYIMILHCIYKNKHID